MFAEVICDGSCFCLEINSTSRLHFKNYQADDIAESIDSESESETFRLEPVLQFV